MCLDSANKLRDLGALTNRQFVGGAIGVGWDGVGKGSPTE